MAHLQGRNRKSARTVTLTCNTHSISTKNGEGKAASRLEERNAPSSIPLTRLRRQERLHFHLTFSQGHQSSGPALQSPL